MNSEVWAGKMIEKGDLKIVPFSQVYRLKSSNNRFGVVWNRPLSVSVIDAEGSERVIPIVDVTRRLQIVILMWGVVAALMILLLDRRK